MTQKVHTPAIIKCHCGADAKCIDWDFNQRYQVLCDNNHSALGTGRCNTAHRAICRWNNAIKSMSITKVNAND